MASMWQRRYAGWVRDAQRLGRVPAPRRVTLLSTRLSRVRYDYGELLFALYVCRDSRLTTEESLREYGFRLRFLGEHLDGSATWRAQYERRLKKQQGAPPDQAGQIEETLWRARGLFSLLVADMEACQQLPEPIYHETCVAIYQEHLAALGEVLEACSCCLYCGERFPHGKPQHRSWCRDRAMAEQPRTPVISSPD